MTKTTTRHQMDMTHGSLWDKLIIFAIPLALTSILQLLFNSADTAVVGHFASSEAQAAVGANNSVISLLVNTFVGMSVGANVLVAKFIGQEKQDAIEAAVHTAVALAFIISAGVVVIGELAAKPILTLMGTPDNVITLAVLYLRIYLIGVPFEMLYNFGAAILRSQGDSRRPLYSLMFSGVVNVILNLFFVILMHMSVAGVAAATVIANGVAAGLVLSFLMTEPAPFTLKFTKLRIHGGCLKQIIAIGAPAGFQSSLFSISNICVQSSVNSFGSLAMAGNSIAQYFDLFAYFFTGGFSQACVTFTSQNSAAGREDRCARVFWLSLGFGMLVTLTMSSTFYLGRGFFLGLYSANATVLGFAATRMLHCGMFQFLEGLFDIPGSSLRGHGHSLIPAVLTVIGTCGYRLGWIFLVFPGTRDYGQLMNVYPISWILTGIMMLIAYARMKRSLRTAPMPRIA